MSRYVFGAAVVAGALAMLAMLVTTMIWMSVPTRIVYRESSAVRTEAYSIEVQEHGKSYYVTPAQKRTLDRIRAGTPIVWFGSLGVAVVAMLAGAGALLKIPSREWRG